MTALPKAPDARSETRWPLSLSAVVRGSGTKFDAAVHDLSTVGCRIECDFDLPTKGYLLILLQGLAPLDGRIVWSDGRIAGLQFHPPLHVAVLDHIVRTNPAAEIA